MFQDGKFTVNVRYYVSRLLCSSLQGINQANLKKLIKQKKQNY